MSIVYRNFMLKVLIPSTYLNKRKYPATFDGLVINDTYSNILLFTMSPNIVRMIWRSSVIIRRLSHWFRTFRSKISSINKSIIRNGILSSVCGKHELNDSIDRLNILEWCDKIVYKIKKYLCIKTGANFGILVEYTRFLRIAEKFAQVVHYAVHCT